MDISNAFPSKYLKSSDLNGSDLTGTIRNVTMEELSNSRGKDTKPVVYFHENIKPFVCNRTNASIIGAMHGQNTDTWLGKQITLFAEQKYMNNQVQMGLSVRMRQTQSALSGNGGAVPTLAQQLAEAKKLAWETYKTKNPGTPEAMNAGFKNLFAAYFPGREGSSIGLNEWQSFLANNFVRPTFTNPLEPAGAAFDASDLPF